MYSYSSSSVFPQAQHSPRLLSKIRVVRRTRAAKLSAWNKQETNSDLSDCHAEYNNAKGPLKNNFTFWHPIFTPSSAAPQSQILEIVRLFLGPAQSVATESDANLGAHSAKLFLSGPLGSVLAPHGSETFSEEVVIRTGFLCDQLLPCVSAADSAVIEDSFVDREHS